MKKLLFALLVVGCDKPINMQTMLVRKGTIYYVIDTDLPYSGRVKRVTSTGQIKIEGNLKDGKKDGRWTLYTDRHKRKREEGNYEDGKRVGKWTWFYTGAKNQIYEEIFFKEGKRDGKWMV